MDEGNRTDQLLACRITAVLVAVNLACFALEEIIGSSGDTGTLLSMGAWCMPLVQAGQYYRFLTSMCLHAGIKHLMSNMISLTVLGHFLEVKIGHLRFGLIYFLGGFAGNLADLIQDSFTGEDVVSVGASGGIYALFGALAFLVLFRRHMVKEISLLRLLLALACLASGTLGEPGVDVMAHAGGFVGGFVVCALLFFRDKGIVMDRVIEDIADGADEQQ